VTSLPPLESVVVTATRRTSAASQEKEFGMKKKSLHPLMLAASIFVSTGLTIASEPAFAQQTQARWKPTLESIIVSAAAPNKNWRDFLSGSHLGGKAFVVSASIPVPYSDLDLAKEPGASELDRRIHLAARLVCLQLDIRYPPAQFPILEGYDCESAAARDGMSHASAIIANAKG
jgi:UrcA family protein